MFGGDVILINLRRLSFAPARFKSMRLVYLFSISMAFCFATVIASTLYAEDLPKAPQAHVFTLTPTPGFFTEPAIAVNPQKS